MRHAALHSHAVHRALSITPSIDESSPASGLALLPDRVAFAERTEQAIAEARMRDEALAVLDVDLDHFAEVNEFFGHATGNALLEALARRLQAAAQGEFLAYAGGDGFLLLSQEPNQPSAAAALSDRIQRSFEEEIWIGGQRMRIGASIGIAVYPWDGMEEKLLRSRAGQAVRRAKTMGG